MIYNVTNMRSMGFSVETRNYASLASVQRQKVPAFAGMTRVLLIAVLIACPLIAPAQSPIDDYVRLGLFFPNITLNARF
ncbi:MAG: hypothetical protein WC865_06420 [Bacteroidales bacterium]